MIFFFYFAFFRFTNNKQLWGQYYKFRLVKNMKIWGNKKCLSNFVRDYSPQMFNGIKEEWQSFG